jgi:hypothetical protein
VNDLPKLTPREISLGLGLTVIEFFREEYRRGEMSEDDYRAILLRVLRRTEPSRSKGGRERKVERDYTARVLTHRIDGPFGYSKGFQEQLGIPPEGKGALRRVLGRLKRLLTTTP